MTRAIMAIALLVTVSLSGSISARQAAPTNLRVMSGLNNPRGLALGPNGSVYVAEAGAGGSGPCRVSPVPETRCFGLSGSITRFSNGIQERVVTGLPSHALPSGDGASGPNDVYLQSNGDLIVGNLNRPTSLVVDSTGSVYYTNRGITPGTGEVWKYTP